LFQIEEIASLRNGRLDVWWIVSLQRKQETYKGLRNGMTHTRHPREGGDPATFVHLLRIPAFAGMTVQVACDVM